MKQIDLSKIKTVGKHLVFPTASFLAITCGCCLFFNSYEMNLRSPIEMELHNPISIDKRTPTIVELVNVIKSTELPLTINEMYLCKIFGDQCKTALEIQRRENVDGDCEAFHINNNGTIDFGYMQINSVHLNDDIKLSKLVDCHGNIDIAYEIYKKSGWKAWTTYKAVIK